MAEPQAEPINSELVSSLLSHRTTNRNSGLAFKSLRKRFHIWEELRDAPVEEVITCIPSVTWPEQKGLRIKAVLQEITIRFDGKLNLDFLQHLPEDEAQTLHDHHEVIKSFD